MARRRRDDDEDDVEETKPRKVSDAYVGMLFISFVCLCGAAALLYVDFEELQSKTFAQPTVKVPGLGEFTERPVVVIPVTPPPEPEPMPMPMPMPGENPTPPETPKT